MEASEAREKISSALAQVKSVAEDETLPEGIVVSADQIQSDLEMLESELQDLEENES